MLALEVAFSTIQQHIRIPSDLNYLEEFSY